MPVGKVIRMYYIAGKLEMPIIHAPEMICYGPLILATVSWFICLSYFATFFPFCCMHACYLLLAYIWSICKLASIIQSFEVWKRRPLCSIFCKRAPFVIQRLYVTQHAQRNLLQETERSCMSMTHWWFDLGLTRRRDFLRPVGRGKTDRAPHSD
jgi:hypothetical protein